MAASRRYPVRPGEHPRAANRVQVSEPVCQRGRGPSHSFDAGAPRHVRAAPVGTDDEIGADLKLGAPRRPGQ